MDEPLLRNTALELDEKLDDPVAFLQYLKQMAPKQIVPVVQAFDRYMIEGKETRFCLVLMDLATMFAASIEQQEKNDIIQAVGSFMEHYMRFHATTKDTIRLWLEEEGLNASIVPKTDVPLSNGTYSKPHLSALVMNERLDIPLDFWMFMANSAQPVSTLVLGFDTYAIPNKESRFHLAVNGFSGIMVIDGLLVNHKRLIRGFAVFVKQYMIQRKCMLEKMRGTLLSQYGKAADVVPTLMKLK